MSTLNVDGFSKLQESLAGLHSPTDPIDPQVLINPLDFCRSHLANVITSIVHCDHQSAYKSIQWPNDICNGDLSITLPKLYPGRKPSEIPPDLLNNFPQDHPLFDLPLPDGVHLRVFLKLDIVPSLFIPFILDRNSTYGTGSTGVTPETTAAEGNNRLVVEFSSPNITSEFHGRYLRSTLIGAFIGRLHELFGWHVTRISYLGDWGKPIALLYVGWTRFGSEEAFEADPVKHLLEVYHQIDELFQPEKSASKKIRDDATKEGKDEGEASIEIESKGIFAEQNEAFRRLESGDEEMKRFWERVRTAVVDDYVNFFRRLGVTFDEYSGESQVTLETMSEIEQQLKDKGFSHESVGAWVVDMKAIGAKAGTAIIRSRTGSSTYLLRDLAAVVERSKKYVFDKMMYVVANDLNAIHFSQMFKILEALDMKDLAGKLQHIKFGDASKMSNEFGRSFKPQTILDGLNGSLDNLADIDAEKAALLGRSDQIKKALQISALIVQELSTRHHSAHAFDLSALSTFKAGSGLDLQYWSAKLTSLIDGQPAAADLTDEDWKTLANEDQVNLLRILAQYPEVLNATLHSLESEGVVTYLGSITTQLASCLENIDVSCTTPGLVAMCQVTKIVLENGMRLLGLAPLSEIPPDRADSPIAA